MGKSTINGHFQQLCQFTRGYIMVVINGNIVLQLHHGGFIITIILLVTLVRRCKQPFCITIYWYNNPYGSVWSLLLLAYMHIQGCMYTERNYSIQLVTNYQVGSCKDQQSFAMPLSVSTICVKTGCHMPLNGEH